MVRDIPIPGLLEIRRTVSMQELGAQRHYVGLIRPGFRLYVVQSNGIVVDSRSLGDSAARLLARPVISHITIPLVGRFIARRENEIELEPGSALVDTRVEPDERWDDLRFTALCVEWDARFGSTGSTGVFRLLDAELELMKEVARAMMAGTLHPTDLHRLLEALAAHTLLDPTRFMLFDEAAPTRAHEFAVATNALFTNFGAHPDLADLQKTLGFSTRHIRRTLRELGPWSPVGGHSFRSRLRQYRVWLAPSLMTAPGATVKRVAAALGYRSPNALILALRQEGMPSPSQARALALDL